VPKVIDFGLAKALHQPLSEHTVYTAHGMMLGTPAYMSPEQAAVNNLDVDTRSDIYSLGVVLYELLTSSTPLERERFKEAAWQEKLRLIKEEEPPRPSTRLSGSGTLASIAAQRAVEPAKLTRLVRGELDWIAMKALEKERSRRYETANGLARDLERYLRDEPVEACPPGVAYRVKKLVRRYRGAVLAVAGVLLALVAGIVGTSWGLVRAEQARAAADAAQRAEAARAEGERQAREEAQAAEKLAAERLVDVESERQATRVQRDRAEANAQEALEEKRIADAVRYFLQQKLLGQADTRAQAYALLRAGGLPTAANRNVTVRELLDRATGELAPDKIEASFPKQPLVQAEILETVGDTYRGVGEYSQAVAFLQRAAGLRQQQLGSDHPGTLATLNQLGQAYLAAHKLPEAIKLFEKLRAAQQAKWGPDHRDALAAMNNLALAYTDAGKLPEAIRLFEQAHASFERQGGPDNPATLTTANNLAVALVAAGKLREAIKLLEQVRAATEDQLGPDHPDTLTTLHNLAGAYHHAGKLSEAINLYERVAAASQTKLGPDHPRTLNTLSDLAAAYEAAGKLQQAIKLYEEVRTACEAKLGPNDQTTLKTLNNFAAANFRVGKLAEAIRLWEQVRAAQEKTLGPDHPNTLVTLNNLAVAYSHASRLPEAIKLYEQVRARCEAKLGPDHPSTLNTLNNLALAYHDTGELAEAIKLWEQVRAAQETKLDPDHPNTLTTLRNLAGAYDHAGRLAEAIKLYERVLAASETKLGRDHPSTLSALTGLAVAHRSAKQLDRSIPLFEELLKRQEVKLGREHTDTLHTLVNQGINYRDAGRLERASSLLEEAYRKLQGRDRSWAGRELLAAYIKADRKADVARLLSELLAAARKQAPPGSAQLAGALSSLGQELVELTKYADAEPILRECLALCEKLSKEPPADASGTATMRPWQLSTARTLLGGALLGQKKYPEAEALLLAGVEGLKRDERTIPWQGRNHIDEALRRLIDLYEATGKPDEAAQWRKQLTARARQ
jgi:hypothetical protein